MPVLPQALDQRPNVEQMLRHSGSPRRRRRSGGPIVGGGVYQPNVASDLSTLCEEKLVHVKVLVEVSGGEGHMHAT